MDLSKLYSTDPRVKYGFCKELIGIAANNPEQLYKNFDDWVALLNHKNNILKWTAIDILGNLSAVDKYNKIDELIPKMFNLLHCGQLITCNHAIYALGIIAKNKPKFKEKIIKQYLKIASDTFDTEECKNIAIGKVIVSFSQFLEDIKLNKPVLDFIHFATFNTRNATKKKAEKCLLKIQISQKIT